MDPAAEQLAPLLARLVNYERLRPDRRLWDLTTMRQLLAGSGVLPGARPAVQIGGSKGKGTTAAFLAALATAGGDVVGVYSSPHLVTLLERIRIAGRDVTVAQLEPVLRRLLGVAGLERPPTFFEAMTAAAVALFREREVDLAIYEVGLGGRHDATTAIPVDVGVVTRIELEHTEVLGDTVEQIAAEKAFVLRPGGLGFTATEGPALAVLRDHAAAHAIDLHALGDPEFRCSAPRFVAADCRFELTLPGPAGGERHDVRIPDGRAFEVPAVALAAATLRAVRPDVRLQLDPTPRPVLAGRFEVFEEPDGEALVLDGAHTEESVRAVVLEVARRWPGRRPAVLCAAAAGKRWRESFSSIIGVADSALVTEVVGTPGETPAVIADWLSQQGLPSETVQDVRAGLLALRQRPGPRLVIGSFYLVGGVRAQLSQP